MVTVRKRRRGSIAIVIVFATVMAILVLGMLRVGMTLFAAGRSTEKQYADINTMRAICESCCYEYITDLETCIATRNFSADMGGGVFAVTDSAAYGESLKALQEELMEEPGSYTWRIRDASKALSAMGLTNADVQAKMLSLVFGKNHNFTLQLVNDMSLDYDNPTTYLGADEARVALDPVNIRVELTVKSETVVTNLSVEGLYLYVQKSTVTPAHGDPYVQGTMRITDDGIGSGVHIYRAD